MNPIVLRRIASEPEQVVLYPDYLVGLLLQHGRGMLEAEPQRLDVPIDFRFRHDRTGLNESVWQCPGFMFRPLLARFAHLVGVNAYSCHAFFQVQFDGETDPIGAGFSLFLSNTSISGYWMKLYLYGAEAKQEQAPA